jgi:aminoglycoside phosphotransferase (APT) family kinase protein
VEPLLAGRPPRSRGQALLRAVWRRLARRGVLAPLFVIARVPGPDDRGPGDPLTALGPVSLTLLTGGRRSINKVVGLAFPPGAGEPAAVAKFARVPEAEGGLEREAEALRVLERERPSLAGVPRLLGEGRRAGALGIVETPLPGRPLLEALAPATFPELAGRVTDHLIELAGTPPRSPRSGWEEALVERPLAELERGFSGVIEASELEAVRAALARLDRLPLVFEHRDCSPWNVILADSGGLGLLDWESSQPRGLPALDLVYFLANAVFVLEGALESGRTREEYSRLLDPGSAHGRVFADCCARYAAALSLGDETLAALRLLCWVVHCASDRRHAELEIAGVPDPDELRRSPFLGLLREELAQRG